MNFMCERGVETGVGVVVVGSTTCNILVYKLQVRKCYYRELMGIIFIGV